MPVATSKQNTDQVAKYPDMLSVMGTEPRLRIMQLLLSAHPDGLVVGDIQSELDIPNSTLSHHLEKLKNEELVNVRRESTFLRYTANTEARNRSCSVGIWHQLWSRIRGRHRTLGRSARDGRTRQRGPLFSESFIFEPATDGC